MRQFTWDCSELTKIQRISLSCGHSPCEVAVSLSSSSLVVSNWHVVFLTQLIRLTSLTGLANFFNTFINPIALKDIQWKYLITYCVWLGWEITFVYFFFPETVGRTLEELAWRKSHPLIAAAKRQSYVRHDTVADHMCHQSSRTRISLTEPCLPPRRSFTVGQSWTRIRLLLRAMSMTRARTSQLMRRGSKPLSTSKGCAGRPL